MKHLAIGVLACALTLSSSGAFPIPDARQPFSLTLHAPTAPLPSRPSPAQVEVNYSASEAAFTLDEPVVVMFSVRNAFPSPITLTLGAQRTQFFQFSLTMPDGKVVTLQRNPGLYVSVALGPEDTPTLQPGADYDQPLIMDKWFQFPSPGTYYLTSQLTTDIALEGGPSLPLEKQTTVIIIKPRNQARLQQVCAKLASEAEKASTVLAAQFPALALSYVNDPVAVPFLAQVLRAHALVYRPAIAGLERIGNDDSVEVLLSALNDSYGDIAEQATSALGRLQDRIANPRLKKVVQEAVKRSTELAQQKYIKSQIPYLDYRAPDLQEAAIHNLVNVPGGLQEAEPVLQRLANDPNQPAKVRSAAKDALKQLHPAQE
jgi:hypothetical protein